LPAARQLAFAKQWRPERIVQREKREETDELWRKLDDLVTDASDCPSFRDLCALSTPNPRARPSRRHCAHIFELMGLVCWRRADGAVHERDSSSTCAQFWAVTGCALGSSDHADAQAAGAG